MQLGWRQRIRRCPDPGCERGTFAKQLPALVAKRGSITNRVLRWAIGQLRREHATVLGLSRRLGTAWKTLWRAVRLLLKRLAADQTRFSGVTSLGVDEHIWHHVDARTRGPKELTGMVDLTRDAKGRVRAPLLDLVPGRSRKAYADWLSERGQSFRQGVDVAALDSFDGYKSAIDQELEDATAVLDGFHVVKLGTQVVDEARRRVQQATLGHRVTAPPISCGKQKQAIAEPDRHWLVLLPTSELIDLSNKLMLKEFELDQLIAYSIPVAEGHRIGNAEV